MSETRHEYEPDTFDADGVLVARGRLIRSVTVHDPEWLEEDRGWALADRANAAGLCPGGCGHPVAETTDPDQQGVWEAPQPVQCFACLALEQRKEEHREADPGRLFHVQRKQVD